MLPLSMVSGCLMSVATFLFFDALAICNQEMNPSDHFHFVLCIPFLFSLLGFALINFTRPGDVHVGGINERNPKTVGCLFAGWLTSFASSIGALWICGSHFTGVGTREHVVPGYELVFANCLIALSAVALWWSKGVEDAQLLF